ncbi:MAG: metallophosphoesterase [Ignavibacteriae bacterium]|nr:metallophosphoesterase [Ignavibacteriota bacterium]
MKLKDIKRMPMVRWFDVKQLASTGIKVIFSTIIGEQTDKRIIQALSSAGKDFYDYSFHYKDIDGSPVVDTDNPRKEMWLDYVSDTGDGWNSTYSVAYYASNPELTLKGDSKSFNTKRGEVLVFGGDEVYPTPSKDAYHKRLIVPFQTAFGDDTPEHKPHVFAIPGNHDWYDGLSAFSKIFCSELNRYFAGWISLQRRSYFALKLTSGWWLFGSDGQLQSDIDTPQIEYFRYVCENHMEKGDRVILCTSQPTWIYAHKYKKFNEPYDESDLIYLQDEILAKKNIDVKVFLSGDLHHYRRHEETGDIEKGHRVQKIIAGGGGAFMHPTNDIDVSLITENYGINKKTKRRFALKESYPDIETSKKLTFRDLLFLFINPGFGIVTAVLYLFTVWMVGAAINYQVPTGFLDTFYLTAKAFRDNPFVALWLLTIFIIFITFTDTHSTIYKWIGGTLHFTAHLICIFYIGWGSLYLAVYLFPENQLFQFLSAVSMVLILGWIAGSCVMGIYLFSSMYFFGRHNEEAFSALKIQDYKNFLRLHIDEDGTLTIYPVKIEKVARKWRNRNKHDIEKDNIKSYIVPEDGSGAELIENPIILKK